MKKREKRERKIRKETSRQYVLMGNKPRTDKTESGGADTVGRGRWEIENEGFNNQKKGLYRIEHLNSKNSNAMKNHYSDDIM